jgi:hypothetical protein
MEALQRKIEGLQIQIKSTIDLEANVLAEIANLNSDPKKNADEIASLKRQYDHLHALFKEYRLHVDILRKQNAKETEHLKSQIRSKEKKMVGGFDVDSLPLFTEEIDKQYLFSDDVLKKRS